MAKERDGHGISNIFIKIFHLKKYLQNQNYHDKAIRRDPKDQLDLDLSCKENCVVWKNV